MKTRYMLPALMVSAFAFMAAPVAPASAAPAVKPAAATASSLILAQYRPDDHHRYRRPPHGRPHYVPGHRYHAPPPGWHRYHARPRDWRHRGCILVGPVWFCP